ncbi:protein phosphatase 1 regulatory subunit 15A-like [Haliotis cracherodii]|uniref:protein phosphatase 1 regulatory subunit 15A-like n=1 Tax=Haliotis cracherodii TaxID=6455 RepID=UPI0039EA1DF9
MAHKYIGITLSQVYISVTQTETSNSSYALGSNDCSKDCRLPTGVAVTLVIINAVAIVTYLWKRRQAWHEQKLSEHPPDVVGMTDDSASDFEYATVADVTTAAEEKPSQVVVGASASREVILVNQTYVSAGRYMKSGTPTDGSRPRTCGEFRNKQADEAGHYVNVASRARSKDTVETNKPGQDTPAQDILDQDLSELDTSEQDTSDTDIQELDTPVQDTLDEGTPERDTFEQDTLYQDIPELDTTVQDTLDESMPQLDTSEQDTHYQDIPELDTTVKDTLDEGMPELDTFEQDTHYQEIPEQDTSDTDTSEQDSLYQEIPELDTPGQDTSDTDTPELEPLRARHI